MCEAAEAAAAQATESVDAARVQLEAARGTLERALARDEVDGLAARVSRIDLTNRQLASVGAELSSLVITAQSLGAIETAARAVGMAEAALETASAQVELRALVDVDIAVNGEQLRVAAGTSGPAPPRIPSRSPRPVWQWLESSRGPTRPSCVTNSILRARRCPAPWPMPG